jgi:hypothetical protein
MRRPAIFAFLATLSGVFSALVNVNETRDLPADALSVIASIVSQRFLAAPWGSPEDTQTLKNLRLTSKLFVNATQEAADEAMLISAYRHCGVAILPLVKPELSFLAKTMHDGIFRVESWNKWEFQRTRGFSLDLRYLNRPCLEHLLRPNFPTSRLAASKIDELILDAVRQEEEASEHDEKLVDLSMQFLEGLLATGPFHPRRVSIGFESADVIDNEIHSEEVAQILDYLDRLNASHVEIRDWHHTLLDHYALYKYPLVQQLSIKADELLYENELDMLLESFPNVISIDSEDGVIPVNHVLSDSRIIGITSASKYCDIINFHADHLKSLRVLNAFTVDCTDMRNLRLKELFVDSDIDSPEESADGIAILEFLSRQKPTLERLAIRIDLDDAEYITALNHLMGNNVRLRQLEVYETYSENLPAFDYLNVGNALETLVLSSASAFVDMSMSLAEINYFLKNSKTLKRFYVDLEDARLEADYNDLGPEDLMEFSSFLPIWKDLIESISESPQIDEIILSVIFDHGLPEEQVTNAAVISKIREFVDTLRPLGNVGREISFNGIPIRRLLEQFDSLNGYWLSAANLNSQFFYINF